MRMIEKIAGSRGVARTARRAIKYMKSQVGKPGLRKGVHDIAQPQALGAYMGPRSPRAAAKSMKSFRDRMTGASVKGGGPKMNVPASANVTPSMVKRVREHIGSRRKLS